MAAICNLCDQEVESHRYIRAEVDEEIQRNGRNVLRLLDGGSYRNVPRVFYHLEHDLDEIEQDIYEKLPPSKQLPVRLFWAPDPAVVVVNKGPVTVRRTQSGQPGLRTVTVHDRKELHAGINSLVPSGTEWYIPHSGTSPDDILNKVTALFGEEDPITKQVRERLGEKL